MATAALVTLAIGKGREGALSHPIFRRYAVRHGLDFVILDTPRIRQPPGFLRRYRNPWCFEKFQLGDWLQRYRRILYLDSDILLAPDCPDLLALVPAGQLGCVFEDTGPLWWERWDELLRAQRRLGPLPHKPAGYFNSGMMVLDEAHRPLFDLPRCPPLRGRWPEQSTLNYHAARLGLPLCSLDRRCNLLPVFGADWATPDRRLAAWVIHYAGQRDRPLLARDHPALLRRWNEPPA